MKRLLSLLTLVALPAMVLSQEPAVKKQQGMMEKTTACLTCGPTSAYDETWLNRTDIGVHWGKLPCRLTKSDKKRSYTMYSLNTVQPIVRSDDMYNTFFGYAGVGFESHRGQGIIGLGLRHMVASNNHMFGVGVNYSHMSPRDVRFRGTGAYVEWLSKYTTLTLSRFWNRWHVSHRPWKSYLKHNAQGNSNYLDLNFQFPYLPWTQVLIGKTWIGNKVGRKSFKSQYRGASLGRLDYGLRLNLLGCLSLEGGYLGGWGSNGFVRLVLNFGRAASQEYALTEGFLGEEAFTARDLKNYTLVSPSRTRTDTRAMIN